MGVSESCCSKDDRSPVTVESAAAIQGKQQILASTKGNLPRAVVPEDLKQAQEEAVLGKEVDGEHPKVTFAAQVSEPQQETSLGAAISERSNPEEFKISLSRERLSGECDLGLDIDSPDGKTLLILKVRDGLVKDWNGRSQSCLKVRHLDRIVEVNGAAGDSSRLQEIIRAERDLLVLTIKRPQEFSVSIDKKAAGTGECGKIGLDIVHSALESLLIKRVKEGLISDWNVRNPEHSIRVGDRIVQINGKRGDSHRLLDLVSSQENLEMIISRTSAE